MELTEIINRISPLPISSLNLLKDIFELVELPQKELIATEGVFQRNMYFLKKGIARLYAYTADTEVTFSFSKEGDSLFSFKSYMLKKAGYENIELLEDSQLYKTNINQLEQLYNSDIHIANWGRRLAEIELIKTEERFIYRQFKTASERYYDLVERHPDLLQRVQLSHIASYLGITQVSLSRIRAQKR